MLLFESSVIFNGTQTSELPVAETVGFESSVIFNGTQTISTIIRILLLFESSVIFNGTQTFQSNDLRGSRLRVV